MNAISLGPGTGFCWTRATFLETSSSPRPSHFREISGKFVSFFSPSADGPSAMWSRNGRNRRKKFWIQSEQSDFWYEPHRCPENGLDKYFLMLSGGPGDASDSPGGHLRGILTPQCSGRGKGPRLFRLRGQISLEISGIVFSFEGSDFQENF